MIEEQGVGIWRSLEGGKKEETIQLDYSLKN